MIAFLKDIKAVLSPAERKKFTRIIFLDIFSSLLDIAFLLMLVFVAGHYTNTLPPEKIPAWADSLAAEYPLLLIGSFTVLYALKNGLGFILFRRQFAFVYDVASRISGNNLSAYLAGSFHDYVNIDSSVRIRRISQQPVEFSHYVLRGVQQVIGNIALILLTIIPILLYNSLVFGLLFLVLIPPALLTAYITRKRLAALRQNGKKYREKTIQYLQEALSGYVESNIYHRKDFFLRRYKRFQDKFNAGLAEHQVMQQLPARLIEVFAILGLFLLVVYNTYISSAGAVPVLLIGGFMAAAYKIIPGIVKILNSIEQVRTYAFTVKDLLAADNSKPEEVKQSNHPIESIRMEGIRFSYRDDPILKNFSMHLKPGDFAGLSGLSGQGKTTVINILLGFLDPIHGPVYINDQPTGMKDRQGYWSRISYIKQQSFFIHDSLRNNITLEEDFENEKLAQVLKVTGIDSIASEYPEGINAIITENGKNMSGGQRQRIALARALYKDADLVILDEPFNELDRVSEDMMLDHFRELAASGKIVLLITHNRESLSFCNKIISLDEN